MWALHHQVGLMSAFCILRRNFSALLGFYIDSEQLPVSDKIVPFYLTNAVAM